MNPTVRIEEKIPTLSGTGKIVTGPDIAAIAYIPQCLSPPGLYSGIRGMAHVFGSGNYDPPAIDGGLDLIRYLAGRREYRGALMISDIAVTFDSLGQAVGVAFTTLNDILGCGYTPVQRLSYAPRYLPHPPPGSQQWRKVFPSYSKGATTGGSRYRLLRRPGQVDIFHWQTFRLNRAMAILARAMTGSSPPFAWIQAQYSIGVAGSCTAYITGSSIPSIQMFSGWTPVQRRCMLSNTAQQINGFLSGNPPRRIAPPFGWREKLL